MNAHSNSPENLLSLKGTSTDALRPLSAIAATRRGLVPQARIVRVLADLAEPLAQLHASNAIHGAISYDSVALNAQGEADIGTPPASHLRSLGNMALSEGRASGYNAFEQYTDDPGWAIGPWTDVYALGAVACMLVTGSAPPLAIDRCVRDTFVPLSERELDADQYTVEFLSAIDQALALRPEDRPATVAALLQAMGCPANVGSTDTASERDKVVSEAAPASVASLPADEPNAKPRADGEWAATKNAGVGTTTAADPIFRPLSASASRQWTSWLFVPAGLGLALLVVYLWLSWSNPFVSRLDKETLTTASPHVEDGPPPIPPGLQALDPAVSTDGARTLGLTSGSAAQSVPNDSEAPAASASEAGPDAGDSSTAAASNSFEAVASLNGASASAHASQTATATAGGTVAASRAATDSSSEIRPPAGLAALIGSPDAVAGSAAAPAAVAAPDAATPSTPVPTPATLPQGATPSPEPPQESRAPTPVAVAIDVQPWGVVSINGVRRGVSPPLRSLSLTPGSYRVTITNPGAPAFSTRITVREGARPPVIRHQF